MYNKEAVVAEQPFWMASSLQYLKEIYSRDNVFGFYHLEQNEDGTERVDTVPDGCATIVFERTASGVKGEIAGTVLEKLEERYEKGKQVYGVYFYPGELPPCIRLPMSELTGKCIPLREAVWNVDWAKRLEETEDMKSWMKLFLQKFKEEPVPTIQQLKSKKKQRIVSDMNQCIIQSGGLISIKELVDKLHYSERYIHEVYKERMGMTPKMFARIMQFQQALMKLESADTRRWTSFGADNGYYDQAHFCKEFKRNTGMSPKSFKTYIEEKNITNRIVSENRFFKQ